MEHEVYTKEEFGNDLPENFEPVEAAMTFSSKLIRDKMGLYICIEKYWLMTIMQVHIFRYH